MKEWHCVLFGQVQGPFLEDRLKEMADAGEIAPDTLVWSGSTQEDASLGWRQASETELAALLNADSPPTPPPTPLRLFSAEEGAPEVERSDPGGEILGVEEENGAPGLPLHEIEPLPEETGAESTCQDVLTAHLKERAFEALKQEEALKAPLPPEPLPEGFEHASRLRRLSGHLLMILMSIVLFATLLPSIYFLYTGNLTLALLFFAASAIAFLLYEGFSLYFLYRDGQGLEKKMLRIRIVNKDGSRTPLWKIIVLRNGIYIALGVCVELSKRTLGGQETGALSILLLALFFVDSLFIFRKDRRTLHDLLAGTIVVKKPKAAP